MPHPRRTIISSTAFLILSAITSQMYASDFLRTVALTGTPVPGAETGAVFTDLRFRVAPLLNNSGHTAFEATYGEADSNKAAILTEGGGHGLRLAASETLSRSDGGQFFPLALQAFNDQGQTAFNSILPQVLAAGQNLGLNRENGLGDTTQVARTQLPPETSGFAFTQLYNFATPLWVNSVSMADSGRLVFPGRATDSGDIGESYAGIWRENDSGGLTRVLRAGDPAPRTAGSFFLPFGEPPAIVSNRIGRVAFIARTTDEKFGIWSEHVDGLHLEVFSGDPAPGIDHATINFGFMGLEFNSQGHLAFPATLRGPGIAGGNDTSLWRIRASGLELLAREGSQAPDSTTGQLFQSFPAYVLNADGNAAFIAQTGGPDGANNIGIWSEGAGSGLKRIAYPGDRAPGTDPGVAFAALAVGLFGTFVGPPLVLNAHGQVAFMGTLQGPGIDDSNNGGIWAQDRAGVLRLIARDGDALNVSNDPLHPDWRTISGLFLSGASGNDDGRRSWFNDRGQLAFLANFTDGTRGIFVSDVATVPEPSVFALLMLGLAACSFKRQR
jgi:hypothetical protein